MKFSLKRYIPVILCVVMVFVFINMVVLTLRASSIGDRLGAGAGSLMGKAIGSLEGMSEGREKGTAAGKEYGLSAEDTEAVLTDNLRKVEKLEVLVASVKLSDFHTIGEGTHYAALYLVNGNIVFTVDLQEAKVTAPNDELHIVLPRPEGALYIDDSSVKKVAEYQKEFFNGSAEDGFDAYLNTMKKVQTASEDTLANYEALLESAEKAAERQVGLLAQSMSSSFAQVYVEFREGEKDAAHE